MSKNTSLLLYVLAPFLLVGCFDDAAKELRGAVQDLNKSLEKSADAIALSVPGEFYMRLLRDVRSEDTKTSGKAKQLAEDLFKISFDQKYVASIWFGISNSASIRADAFQSSIPGSPAVQQHIVNRQFTPTTIRNSMLPLPTEAQRIAAFRKTLDRSIATMEFPTLVEDFDKPRTIGGNQVIRSERITLGIEGPESAVSKRGLNLKLEAELQKVSAGISAAVENLLHVGYFRPADGSLPIEWNLLLGRPLLYVVVPTEDWRSQGGEILVSAIVHVKGKPEDALQQQRVYTFRKEEFQELKIDQPNVPGGSVMFAFKNMDPNSVISGESLIASSKLKKLIEDFQQEEKADKQK